MDYSVGSLSDLITGSVTPNKKKVIKKKIHSKNVTIEESSPAFNDSPKELNSLVAQKKVKTLKTPGGKSPKITAMKRKSTESNAEMPSPKKSKNAKNAERRLSFKQRPQQQTGNKREVPLSKKGKNIEIGEEKGQKEEEDPELLARTVFVGNLPITADTHKFKKFFAQYGKVDTVRIRGVPVANIKTPKKVAFIKKEFHPDRKSYYGFVRFEERESAIKAAEANGTMYMDHHLRIHLCDTKEKPDESKAIFVGNLNFRAEENDLWNTFEDCGAIVSVRIVRDSRTGMGKGFGYVNFEHSDSVTLALEMENVKIKDREVRISICNLNAAKKNVKNKKDKKISKPRKVKTEKDAVKTEEINDAEDNKVAEKPFQGVKFVAKKKKKLNKGLLQKKWKVKQIAPK